MTGRDDIIKTLQGGETFDLLVVGGGATGCGVALDAASRGLKVALAEKGDFACGTSGRSTKLLHGGVRYLEAAVLHLDRVQFNLVRDALAERGLLLKLAPHLTRRLTLITPLYRLSDIPYLLAGLKLYDLLAGDAGLGASRFLSASEMLERFSGLKREGLKGGVLYYDGQFDDARFNLALALTAIEEGAAVASRLEVVALLKKGGKMAGGVLRDRLSGREFEVAARCVVNACGPQADRLRALDDPAAPLLLQVSSGTHLLLPRRFWPHDEGVTIPKTEDGRVLFILPWHGGCLVGTTDHPAPASDQPRPLGEEIDYLLRHLSRHFDLNPTRADLLACWSGLRPLVRDPAAADTASLARDHVVSSSPSGLITVVGGKWTTYRKMARDTVDFAAKRGGLTPRSGCRTATLPLYGAAGFDPAGAGALAARFALTPESAAHLNQSYGALAPQVAELCRGESAEPLAAGYPYLKGELYWGMRREFVLGAADFLARRLPLALLDRAAAERAAPWVLSVMTRELGWDGARQAEERQEVALWTAPCPGG